MFFFSREKIIRGDEMKKNKVNKIVWISVFMVIVILVFYFMSLLFTKTDLNNIFVKIFLYETSDYPIYKQFNMLMTNSYSEQMEYSDVMFH